MMNRMRVLIDEWDPDQSKVSVFIAGEDQSAAQGNDAYFLSSSDKIHFFLERGALDPFTKSIRSDLPKHDALNKVGHGLHSADPVFKAYSESAKVSALVRNLGWQNPVLPQSMYIFKQKLIGDVVCSHQDSTFLHTTPRLTCLGLWLALEDATLDNGCLWVRPGSHKEGLRRVYVRNPDYFEKGDYSAPMMTFQNVGTPEAIAAAPWDGLSRLPDDLAAAGFIPAPIEAGDLFVIHGEVDHLSKANTSEKGRQTFQLHLVEGPKSGVTWSPLNWLQTPGKEFPPI